MDAPESPTTPPAEAALDESLRRWSVGLAPPLGTPAQIVPAGWQALPVSDWLALGMDWALGALRLSWRDGGGTMLVGMPGKDLGRLAELEGDPGSEEDQESLTRLWGGVLDAGVAAFSAARDAGGGKLGCEVAWSRVSWKQEELGDLAGEVLAAELLISACAVQLTARDFTATLHLGVPPGLLEGLAPPAPPAPAARTTVVAVVAFDPKLRRELREAARAFHPEVAEFSDAREYLKSKVVRRTKLLLLGVCLENRTALQHCRALRQEPRLKDVPLLMCAPIATRDLLLEAISAGAHGFAVSPFSETVPQQVKKIVDAA